MSVEVGRRVFVGSVVTGLPVLAGGGVSLAWAQRQGVGVRPIQDPVFLHIVEDMKLAVRNLSKAPSGEHARRLASSLRLLATWGGPQQLDARVKDTLRGVIAREGRQSLLRREINPSMLRSEARTLGFDGAAAVSLPALPPIDLATRQMIVDDLLANGVTSRWKVVADTLDAAAASLDRLASAQSRGLTLIAQQQDPSICQMINQELYYLSVQMVFWCAPWFWWIPEPCGMATSAYLGVWVVGWWYGC